MKTVDELAQAIAGLKGHSSEEYKQAIENHNAALAIFRQVTLDYRARLIDDDTYLAAQMIMKDADKAFDAAFNKEQGA